MRWLGGVTGHVLGMWIGSRGASCHCSFEHDTALLGVLKTQLDRCGPEQLTGPPAPTCPGLSTWAYLAICLLCLISFVTGAAVSAVGLSYWQRQPANVTTPLSIENINDVITPPRRSSARLLRQG